MKTMVIVPGLKYYYFSDIDNDNVSVLEEHFLSEKSKWRQLIQRLSKIANLSSIYKLFAREWIDVVQASSRCIIFDQAFSSALAKAVHNMNPTMKIYVYCWNPISKNPSILKKVKSVSNIITAMYSFDKDDCQKYDLRFAPMVYNFDAEPMLQKDIKYDVCFVGYLKSRGQQISELYTFLIQHNYSTFFYVLDSKGVEGELPFPLHKRYLSYQEYMDVMAESKAVLDITQQGQRGLTIRTLETLCYQKKLITNNADIMTYDFYNPANIFIIGRDNMDNFRLFIDSPFVPVNKSVLKKYNFVDWVNNFNE